MVYGSNISSELADITRVKFFNLDINNNVAPQTDVIDQKVYVTKIYQALRERIRKNKAIIYEREVLSCFKRVSLERTRRWGFEYFILSLSRFLLSLPKN